MSTSLDPVQRPSESLSLLQRMRSLRVALAGKLTAQVAPGGGETQMAATAAALNRLGHQASFWRPWEHDLRAFDCLHLFGSLPEHACAVEAARQAGIAVVLSPITWFDVRSCWLEPRPLVRRLRDVACFALRAAVPSCPSWRRSLYHSVDLLLPNSHLEAAQLRDYFQLPTQRIAVVPNGADPRFADAQAAPLEPLADRGYVLYAGRIEPRKNQLTFLQAMRPTGLPTVVLGDPVPGHECYYEQCRQAAGPAVRFVPRIEHDDPSLATLYAGARCLALCSWYETPGLVALEAGMSGVPLVLPVGGSAREYFGSLAQYVPPHDRSAIRRAVLAAWQQPRSSQLARMVRERYAWNAVARATEDAYGLVV